MLKLTTGILIAIMSLAVTIMVVDGSREIATRDFIRLADPARELYPFGVLVLGTVLGILSSLLIRDINKNGLSLRQSLNRRSLLVSCLLAPVLVGGLYERVADLSSFTLLFIISHQNGFFWESISSLVNASIPDSDAN